MSRRRDIRREDAMGERLWVIVCACNRWSGTFTRLHHANEAHERHRLSSPDPEGDHRYAIGDLPRQEDARP